MLRKDPLVHAAMVLYRRYTAVRGMPEKALSQQMHEVAERAVSLKHFWYQIRTARHRGWNLTAANFQQELPGCLRRLASACQAILDTPIRPELPRISLPDLVAELRQLKAEFEDIDIDCRPLRISVTTEPIELEGIQLGPFTIDLNCDRLWTQPDSDCFNCAAEEPNRPNGHEDVTHPHVQSDKLCAGEAKVPIASALREGRICDAFCLVASVLRTYNSASPYVSLANWDGKSCTDCGYTIPGEEIHWCVGCEKDFCDDCISSCDICGESFCKSCLELDTETDHECCSGCCHRCGECSRIVETADWDSATGLCPQCLEEERLAQDKSDLENEHDPTHTTPALTVSCCPLPVAMAQTQLTGDIAR